MSVTRLTEMETAMSSLCSDVNKLMDVAGQHGDHLREIFSAVPRFATKTELIAAIASVRQYKSNTARASSKFSGESQEDADIRMSKMESGLKALTQAVRSSARTNKEREEMVEEHQTTITTLRQTNRKLEMRLKATEDEMKQLKEQVGLLTSHGPMPSIAVPPSLLSASMDENENYGVAPLTTLPTMSAPAGNNVENGDGGADEAAVEKNKEMEEAPSALKGSPSEDLDNILSVPGPKSTAEIEREVEAVKEKERAVHSAIEKASKVEEMLAERLQQDALRTAQEEEYRRNTSLELQRLTEFQSAHLATSSLSNEGIESLIGTSVSLQLDRAMNTAKRGLTSTLKEHTSQSIAASEKRVEVSLEQKLRRLLPDVDAFGDMVSENTKMSREVRRRLEGVEQVLSLLDAEHSSIVSAFRQHELDRAASDHYCYSAIDTLTQVLDKSLVSHSLHVQRHGGSDKQEYSPVPPPPIQTGMKKPVTKVDVRGSAVGAEARPPRKVRLV